MVDMLTYVLVFAALSIVSTYLVATAYRKVQYSLKHK